MTIDTLQAQSRFLIGQKITALVNRYSVSTQDGRTVAVVQQKRFSFKEEVVFYGDEDRRSPLFRFRARSVLDLGATYDVTDPAGRLLGSFRKDFARSLLRSTWHVEPVGLPPLVGRERSTGVAIARRVWEVVPYVDALPFAIPYHFDFVADGGQPVFSVEKKVSLRDRYVLELHEGALDRRLAIAMAVALDALQSR